MDMKKIVKVILKGLACVLALALLFTAGVFINHRIKLSNDRKTLEEMGYYNPVSTGDHSLNVYRTGNEDGEHTIVVLTGWSDGVAYLGWEPMTSELEEDNEFYYIDRAGYGLSEDTDDEMSIEYIIEDYRTALRNSGEEGPYVLLGHSIGGLYAACWASAYPDEVEAVIMLDGTKSLTEEQWNDWREESGEEIDNVNAGFRLLRLLAKTGLLRLDPQASGFDDMLTDFDSETQELLFSMTLKTYCSRACLNEADHIFSGEFYIWSRNSIVANDIPKLYIAAEDYEQALSYIEILGNTEIVNLPGEHEIQYDRPEDCRDIIMDFLNNLDQTA